VALQRECDRCKTQREHNSAHVMSQWRVVDFNSTKTDLCHSCTNELTSWLKTPPPKAREHV